MRYYVYIIIIELEKVGHAAGTMTIELFDGMM